MYEYIRFVANKSVVYNNDVKIIKLCTCVSSIESVITIYRNKTACVVQCKLMSFINTFEINKAVTKKQTIKTGCLDSPFRC